MRAGFHVRFYVYRRDKGLCAKCGADAALAERVLIYAGMYAGGWRTVADADADAAAGVIREAWGRFGTDTASFWEADHTVPVAEGGGGCGLDGYRTLCRPCHLEETRLLRARLAQARRSAA